jgi:succinyl-diaminopimelate desuccinylase
VHRRRAVEREDIGDTIKIGRRGSFSGRLTVHGVQGHVAYPQLAENPVHALAPALAELTSRRWDEGNEHFQPTTFQISNLNAGTGAPNVIPGELKARFNLRYSPVQTLDGLKETVEGILRKHGIRYTLEWYLSGEPFYTPPGPLSTGAVAAVEQVACRKPKLSTGGGTSDGRFIAPMGAQVIELGVVNSTIHKVNECVRVADIDTHCAGKETQQVACPSIDPAGHRLAQPPGAAGVSAPLRLARAAAIWRSTSSIERWRMSLPSTM